MKRFFLVASLFLLGAGCTARTVALDPIGPAATGTDSVQAIGTVSVKEPAVILPIDEYAKRRTFKVFGQLVHDRFNGYHLGDDIEYTDATGTQVNVYSIADAKIRYLNPHVSGYGGVIVIQFSVNGQAMNALYGHLDLRHPLVRVGETVKRGQTIAILGEGGSYQTDGERKHLHFSVYPGTTLRLQGYVSTKAALKDWINPQDFFTQQGIDLPPI